MEGRSLAGVDGEASTHETKTLGQSFIHQRNKTFRPDFPNRSPASEKFMCAGDFTSIFPKRPMNTFVLLLFSFFSATKKNCYYEGRGLHCLALAADVMVPYAQIRDCTIGSTWGSSPPPSPRPGAGSCLSDLPLKGTAATDADNGNKNARQLRRLPPCLHHLLRGSRAA